MSTFVHPGVTRARRDSGYLSSLFNRLVVGTIFFLGGFRRVTASSVSLVFDPASV